MLLTLLRRPSGPKATLGDLDIDGIPFCITLEDVVRADPDPATPANEAKVYGETAIPAGRYKIEINFSQKFQKLMIAVLDVPGFTGIRIHSLNDAEETLGCIGVGAIIDGPNRIHGGSTVLPHLFSIIQEALSLGESVWLEIKDASTP